MRSKVKKALLLFISNFQSHDRTCDLQIVKEIESLKSIISDFRSHEKQYNKFIIYLAVS
jgi:hypothetical protein